MEPVQRAPEYVVLHDSLGGVFSKGDMVPHGTYDDEQLARLVGLGAIEAVDPAGEDFEGRVDPSVPVNEARAGGEDGARLPDSPAAQAPQSAEEFKERQNVAALQAAGGADGSLDGADLTDAQQTALADAGYRTAADVRAASDADLRKVDGIGDAAVKRLREATGG